MKLNRKLKIVADSIILFCSIILLCGMFFWKADRKWILLFAVILLLGLAGTTADIIIQMKKDNMKRDMAPPAELTIRQLILLDEQDRPVKSWDISGKTAVVIGKRNDEEEVDVDLEDCAYSAFIEPQHAALNFCHNSWYVEDLGSQNGVKIGKIEDGACYKVFSRPCRVMPGDILYIANTRLLLT